jgi:hypothetical protein
MLVAALPRIPGSRLTLEPVEKLALDTKNRAFLLAVTQFVDRAVKEGI